MISTQRRAGAGLKTILLAGAACGLLAGPAVPFDGKVGDVEFFFSTTISAGGSLRTATREDEFLSEGNGGNVDPRTGGAIIPFNIGFGANVAPQPLGTPFLNNVRAAFLAPPVPITTGQIFVTNNNDNFDGSVNTDDGRLNFDRNDLIGATAKATHELQVNWRNFTVFGRAVGFYDFVLTRDDAGQRSELTSNAEQIAGASYDILDLYVSGLFDLGAFPLNLRVGKQVVSWGESTFIQNGLNVVNPFDVAAFRRPGSEIREGLVPVNMVYASLGLQPLIPGLSIEGWYQLEFDPVRIDPAGTPFSTADVVESGSGLFGNEFRRSYLSGSPLSGPRRNCNPFTAGFAGGGAPNNMREAIIASGLLPNPFAASATYVDCSDGPFIHYQTPITIGLHEEGKNDLIRRGVVSVTGAGAISRGATEHADDDGQWGVALRYYADWLNDTEFGLFAMNYHSRLPYLSQFSGTPELGIAVQGDSSNITPDSLAAGNITGALAARFLGAAGALAPTTLLLPPFTALDPRINALAGSTIADPHNLLNPTSIGTAATVIGQAQGLAGPALAAFVGAAVAEGDSMRNAVRLQQVLAVLQGAPLFVGGTNTGLLGFTNGSENVIANPEIDLLVQYPEDVQLFGLSFNTTLFGQAVQGEVSYRPDAPFQADTDQLTIASAMSQCAFLVSGSNAASQFEALGTTPGSQCNPLAVGNREISGIIENDMWTMQIGTTSSFNASNPVIDFLGADSGLLVTEVGAVYVPGVEDTWLTNDDGTPRYGAAPNNDARWFQYQNTGCQGSDLPLGGLLSLDFKRSKDCRPTNWSAGYVLLARLEYNNAFGSGWLVTPQVSFSHDVIGATPAPYGNFLEGRKALGLSVAGSLNRALELRASWSLFFGGDIRNKAVDQDFATISVSYTF